MAHYVLHGDTHRGLQQENLVKQLTQTQRQILAEFRPLPPEEFVRKGHPQCTEFGSCFHVGVQFGTVNGEWE